MEKEERRIMKRLQMNKKYFTAIDLGTNSCKVVIADQKKKYVYFDAFSVRMGEGMYPEMMFTPEAMNRGVKCFYDIKKVMEKYNVSECRAISTASCRMAKNAPEFIKRVYDESMIKIEIVDGYEEARINLKGALQHVMGKTKYVVLYDLGGGSTEITLATNAKNPEIIHTISIPWGARNASEAFELVEFDEIKAKKLEDEILGFVDAFVKDCDLDKYREDICFVATSSTPLRFVSMIEKFGKYDRDKSDGKVIKCCDIDKQIEYVYKLSQPEMLQNSYIGAKRSYIFTAACVIFKTIYKQLGAKEITASLKSAKDGIIEELVDQYNQQQKKLDK